MYVFCFELNGCWLTKEQGSPASGIHWGTGSSGMGRINRDIAQLQGAQELAAQRERKAGIRAMLQRTRRLGAEQGRHSHQTCHTPHGATVWGGL